jgi:crotonobetainyl-CoA:carnitine CoA-transferase CaiB-like acyl-CoA transferase
VIQAESGFLEMNGEKDRQGVRAASPVMDIGAAMMAANAILAALYARTTTGVGQSIEVALFDIGILMTGHAAMQHLIRGSGPVRTGNDSLDIVPSGVFHCKDGSFYLNCANDRMFNRLTTAVLERPDLAVDPVLAKSAGRRSRREEVLSILGREFLKQPWSYWEPKMRAAAMPCGQVRTLASALRSQEARSRNLVTCIHHPKAGKIPNIALPLRFSETPLIVPAAPPSVGEHTRPILNSLSYSGEEIDALLKLGAVQTAPP